MLSRSALAHIYENLKPKTTVTSGSTRRGLYRARNARIQFKKLIDFFLPAAAGSARSEPASKRPKERPKDTIESLCNDTSHQYYACLLCRGKQADEARRRKRMEAWILRREAERVKSARHGHGRACPACALPEREPLRAARAISPGRALPRGQCAT